MRLNQHLFWFSRWAAVALTFPILPAATDSLDLRLITSLMSLHRVVIGASMVIMMVASKTNPETCHSEAGTFRQRNANSMLQSHSKHRIGANAKVVPQELMTCSGTPTMTTSNMTCAEYDAITKAITELWDSLSPVCNATSCQQADWAGCVLRMAGHDFMDFKDGQGGADACTDMNDGDNAGLAECLVLGEHGVSINDAYQKYCTTVSLADFLVIAAEAVMTASRSLVLAEDSSAPLIDFRSSFQFGRTTAMSCDFAAGRLPNPENGCSAVEETFINSMGLSWAHAAALMGVHTLGQAKISNSGYDGWWSDPENSRRFNNNYYVSMLIKGWIPEKNINNNSHKNQWERSDEGADPNVKEMMLDTDMCLAFGDANGDLSAKSMDCCAWVRSTTPRITDIVNANGGLMCGDAPEESSAGVREDEDRGSGGGEFHNCCGDEFWQQGVGEIKPTCGESHKPSGIAFQQIRRFADDESQWLQQFLKAWTQAIENGFTGLKPLQACSS
eukprot:TRINITY_DN680_c0_g1_i5.p1 TRINITY_DN680_c0_g1~~TRINITY_DN680_c0_g1_i5.p1  ORF type:complete len:502 (-),score=84.83 TRINITY_DN680_c0_g1_i5:226-1731(-)